MKSSSLPLTFLLSQVITTLWELSKNILKKLAYSGGEGGIGKCLLTTQKCLQRRKNFHIKGNLP
jgi:hypothetical protein